MRNFIVFVLTVSCIAGLTTAASLQYQTTEPDLFSSKGAGKVANGRQQKRGLLDGLFNNQNFFDHIDLLGSALNSNSEVAENRNANTKATGPGDNAIYLKDDGEGHYRKDRHRHHGHHRNHRHHRNRHRHHHRHHHHHHHPHHDTDYGES
ncbi:uncharacterized protein VTP21DRAFT_6875 [Calcarisporiella thermophila]|uniref:uncharacterized protein n=1 Tax=Calcarisporiella thermophila TaxID=911321 RepID=UPI00374378BD